MINLETWEALKVHQKEGATKLAYISHDGDKWLVHAKDGEVLGHHDSKESALAQLRAIEVHKHGAYEPGPGTEAHLRDQVREIYQRASADPVASWRPGLNNALDFVFSELDGPLSKHDRDIVRDELSKLMPPGQKNAAFRASDGKDYEAGATVRLKAGPYAGQHGEVITTSRDAISVKLDNGQQVQVPGIMDPQGQAVFPVVGTGVSVGGEKEEMDKDERHLEDIMSNIPDDIPGQQADQSMMAHASKEPHVRCDQCHDGVLIKRGSRKICLACGHAKQAFSPLDDVLNDLEQQIRDHKREEESIRHAVENAADETADIIDMFYREHRKAKQSMLKTSATWQCKECDRKVDAAEAPNTCPGCGAHGSFKKKSVKTAAGGVRVRSKRSGETGTAEPDIQPGKVRVRKSVV